LDWSKKLILTDVDGVLFDWEYGFDRWVRKHHGLKTIIAHEYNLSKRYDQEKGKMRDLVQIFNESNSAGVLTPFRDSVKFVRKLREERGVSFHAITSMSDQIISHNNRMTNLETVFGKGTFETLTCLPLGGDKRGALEEYRDTGCVWVEDSYDNAVLGADMGLQSLLMDHPYNQNVERRSGVSRVFDWENIWYMFQ